MQFTSLVLKTVLATAMTATFVGIVLTSNSMAQVPRTEDSIRENLRLLQTKLAEAQQIPAAVGNAIEKAKQLPGNVLREYDNSSAESKMMGGFSVASLSSSLWVVKNLDQPFGRMRGRIFVVSFAVSLVVLVDGLWQAYEQQDRSILFRFAESMVESLADIRTLADGKLTTYYASEQGFAQFLSLPTDAAYSYAQMDRKLATKINMIANEIRKAEASGANVSFGTF